MTNIKETSGLIQILIFIFDEEAINIFYTSSIKYSTKENV
jgi:hypothetical protein